MRYKSPNHKTGSSHYRKVHPKKKSQKGEKINTRITKAAADASSTQDAAAKIREIFTPQIMETMGVNAAQVEMLIAQTTTPWTRYFLGYDPINYLPKITIPILALNGELDIQVPAQENLDGASVNSSKTTQIQQSPSCPGSTTCSSTQPPAHWGEYNDIEETFAPKAMSIIADWINERFN